VYPHRLRLSAAATLFWHRPRTIKAPSYSLPHNNAMRCRSRRGLTPAPCHRATIAAACSCGVRGAILLLGKSYLNASNLIKPKYFAIMSRRWGGAFAILRLCKSAEGITYYKPNIMTGTSDMLTLKAGFQTQSRVKQACLVGTKILLFYILISILWQNRHCNVNFSRRRI
jgi:hypothetical protein